jgi:hypothetical protein
MMQRCSEVCKSNGVQHSSDGSALACPGFKTRHRIEESVYSNEEFPADLCISLISAGRISKAPMGRAGGWAKLLNDESR